MRLERTRRFGIAAVLLAVSALLLVGCAPHRRGPLPAQDSTPQPQPRTPGPAAVAAAPAEPVAPSVPPRAPTSEASPAARVCALAESFLGTPYRWGGATPKGFDCSGLVQYVFGRVGVDLPRNSRQQARSGRAGKVSELAPGDLIFFRIDRNVISHVGIHVGDGVFVHAPGTGKRVRKDDLGNDWWRKRVMGVRRVL